jgi:hypothetical protein
MIGFIRVALAGHILDCGINHYRNANFCADNYVATCNFTIFIMAAQITRRRDLCKSAICRIVISENIHRIFAGMETASACFNFSFVRVSLANLKLESTALQILVKSLISLEHFNFPCVVLY